LSTSGSPPGARPGRHPRRIYNLAAGMPRVCDPERMSPFVICIASVRFFLRLLVLCSPLVLLGLPLLLGLLLSLRVLRLFLRLLTLRLVLLRLWLVPLRPLRLLAARALYLGLLMLPNLRPLLIVGFPLLSEFLSLLCRARLIALDTPGSLPFPMVIRLPALPVLVKLVVRNPFIVPLVSVPGMVSVVFSPAGVDVIIKRGDSAVMRPSAVVKR
jgi:hypothetical protein